VMAPAPQVSGLFTIQTSVGEYSETCLSSQRTFALCLKLAGATAGVELEVEQLSQCSVRSRSPPAGVTHGMLDQADVQFGHRRWTQGQLYEAQLTPVRLGGPAAPTTASLKRELTVPTEANGQVRVLNIFRRVEFGR